MQRVCFQEENLWEHALWDAAEGLDETTLSVGFQQQVLRGFGKLEQDLQKGFERLDRRLEDLLCVSRDLRLPFAGACDADAGNNSDPLSTMVMPSQSRNGPSPKSWASPFQDSVEFLRSLRTVSQPVRGTHFSIFATRRADYPVREALWAFLVDPLSSYAARSYALLYPVLLLISVALMLIESSHPDLQVELAAAQLALDGPFLLDALVRFLASWSCWRYLCDVCNIVDLLALVPVVLNVLLLSGATGEAAQLAKLCVFPTVKMLKLIRFCPQLHVVFDTLLESFEAVFMLVLMCLILLLSFGAAFFFCEPRTSVSSMPQAVYFMLLTMSTVGSNDRPATPGGDLVTSLAVVASLVCLGLPLAIIGTSRWQDRDLSTFARRARTSMQDWGFSELYFEKLAMEFDPTGTGHLSLADFHLMAQELHLGFRPKRLVPIFQALDVGRTGSVEVSDLLKLLLPSRRRWPWADAGASIGSPHAVPGARRM
ncbi:unnamed protein product [Effrenium voratum]|nr:unnamed protein product [Effrenium voratum]